MTKKLFWDDPYQAACDTVVASVSGAEVTLAETIFYAFSGGQESDHGTIGGRNVFAARKEGLEIVYTLAENHGLSVGQKVRVEIDWARRYRLMRLHFAAELVLALFTQKFPALEKVGAHIAQDKARLDFAMPESVSPLLSAFAEGANKMITDDLVIVSAFEDEASQKRYWEIDGFARVPCGGTHIKCTSEVGPIKLRRNNIGRGKERVEIYLV